MLLRRGGGGAFLAGVVAAFGADGEFAVAFGLGVDFDLAKAAAALGVGRFVADGVLVADVVRGLLADGVDFVDGLGEKGDAAGFLGDELQRFVGAALLLFP